MAVVAVWKCDRDGAMFDNKKEAEEHDKMLELAINITHLIEKHIPAIDEDTSEKIGLMLAQRSDTLSRACKGKPELLLEEDTLETTQGKKSASDNDTDKKSEKITSIAAKR